MSMPIGPRMVVAVQGRSGPGTRVREEGRRRGHIAKIGSQDVGSGASHNPLQGSWAAMNENDPQKRNWPWNWCDERKIVQRPIGRRDGSPASRVE